MVDRDEDERAGPSGPPYPADAARGAEIVFTSRRHRLIFVGGLVGFVLLTLILVIFAPT